MRDSLRFGFLLFLLTTVARPQTATDLSGVWQQENDRCQPRRTGDVTLHIEHHGTELVVETSMVDASSRSRHAVQRYTVDGDVSVSKGVDGDEFYTKVVHQGSSLIFSIEEHEDGRILHSKETWSLIEKNATLERIRERPGKEKQILFYRRR
jgi:hypothetical protein